MTLGSMGCMVRWQHETLMAIFRAHDEGYVNNDGDDEGTLMTGRLTLPSLEELSRLVCIVS